MSVDMQCVTPMEKSPAKLHRRLLFTQIILLLGLYSKDILGEIEVVAPCTKQLDYSSESGDCFTLKET